MAERGPAYNFWVRVKTEQATRGWSDSELNRRSGVSRNTIKDLGTRTRVEAETINALADALDIPRTDAHRLAGIVPADAHTSDERRVSVREAILADPNYNEQQRQTMLQLVDIIDQANRAGGGEQRRAG
ncbi:helix-turn-helix transcriptional regulator [Micromonospora sp. C41]|uniref:helix-turn-helix domain-containing protein n=1 Tax=Micromonospora sp. C41 TaxID=2824878 RepID=UPI001B37BB99|nr:helix-turn-helix transcriptional regulator [Micromonospora sp. C41]MBQ1064521.1 helix-turn-helix transcriptional regulator [Micromonospora sp. C41]